MPRKAHKYHYIYKTTCNVTGRYYIGMHSTSNLEDSYMGSGKRLKRSLNKYGIKNHIKEILEFLNDRESLAKRESEIVNEQSIEDPLCMNLKPGGFGGGGFSKEDSLKGTKKMLDNLWSNIEWIERKKINSSNVLKKLHTDGKIKYDTFKGKSHTAETKLKISEKAKERIADKNSQFGTCWITNGKENKKIKKGDSIPEDWSLGRKMK